MNPWQVAANLVAEREMKPGKGTVNLLTEGEGQAKAEVVRQGVSSTVLSLRPLKYLSSSAIDLCLEMDGEI